MRYRLTLRATDGMKKGTWEVLQARIWDVQDNEEFMWDILTIEGEATNRVFYLASREKMESLKKWLEEQRVDDARFTASSDKMDRAQRGAYAARPGVRASVGLFAFRLVLSHSVKEDIEVIQKVTKK